jgi:precorrin-2/cobalt-factor-2 C20-methyltransferase
MRLIGVGTGPGDPELLTLKAVRVLATAGRVFAPAAGRALATIAGQVPAERLEPLAFALDERGLTDRRERHWDEAGARVAAWLAGTGGTAAFATIGDPNLYSTFGYLAQTVRSLLPEVVVETVPGITAMQALASASGTPLAEGAESLHLLPVPGELGGVLARDATVVLYKAGRHLAAVRAALRDAGRDAVFGAHLGLPDESVGRLSDVDGAAPYLSTVLIPARRNGRGSKL